MTAMDEEIKKEQELQKEKEPLEVQQASEEEESAPEEPVAETIKVPQPSGQPASAATANQPTPERPLVGTLHVPKSVQELEDLVDNDSFKGIEDFIMEHWNGGDRAKDASVDSLARVFRMNVSEVWGVIKDELEKEGRSLPQGLRF